MNIVWMVFTLLMAWFLVWSVIQHGREQRRAERQIRQTMEQARDLRDRMIARRRRQA